MLLDQLLTAYSRFPHQPGKGVLYERLMPLVSGAWKVPRLCTRFGVRLECDLNDKVTREIYYTGFNRIDCRVLKRFVRPENIILNAGANVGYFSLLCAKWMHGKGAVHSFEPFPDTARRFQRNLETEPGPPTHRPLVPSSSLGLRRHCRNERSRPGQPRM